MSGDATRPRMVQVRLHLAGGHVHDVCLAEDAPELHALFRALVERGAPRAGALPPLIQLPTDGGRGACTVAPEHVVSVTTAPPVLVNVQPAGPEPPAVGRGVPPPAVVIDDFLGPDEHDDMLAFALRDRASFEPSTADGRKSLARRNSVIMDFSHAAHAQLLGNRILTWLPVLLKELAMPAFTLGAVESQLTVSNHGDYYRSHLDTGAASVDRRRLSCVYYFHRRPKGFAGGALRLHDAMPSGDGVAPTGAFREIEPVDNRLVVFSSRTCHELMPVRCPSRDFADARFAVTTWLHAAEAPDRPGHGGWGHYRIHGAAA